jgi:Na+-translocating ferredoxin:NAD+ oxidoreductase RnfG subunit
MNTPGLFIVGAGVTLIVVAAIAILLYGAVLDGRDARQERDDEASRRAAADAVEAGAR